MHQHPLEHIRRELVVRLYTVAITLDHSFNTGAGEALLGVTWPWPSYDAFDLGRLGMETLLRDLYDYAYLGQLKRERFDTDLEGGEFGRILALVDLSNAGICGRNLEDIEGMFDTPDQPWGGLQRLIDLVKARMELDKGHNLTLEDVGLLAGGLDPKSVRSAMYKGEGSLKAFKENGQHWVRPADALQWLRKRSGFVETNWLVQTSKKLPGQLGSEEIIPFIARRINEIWRGEPIAADYHRFLAQEITLDEVRPVEPIRYSPAAEVIGWTAEQLEAVLQGSAINLKTDDVPTLARMIQVDRTWFAQQVRRAHEAAGVQTEESSQHQESSEHIRASTRLIENGQALEATLSSACVKNGNIDIQSAFVGDFFPADSIGGRSRESSGVPVFWHFDGKTEKSDVKKMSEVVHSPRRRFSSWFRKSNAQPGDMVIIRRVADRSYQLTFKPISR